MSGTINQIVVALATIASGPAFWGLVQWIRGRKGAKAQAAKDQQADEKANRQAEIDRANLLAEAQRTAQKTALESANAAYSNVQKECDKCNKRLETVERRCEALITATEAFIAGDTPASRAACIAALWEARHAI